MNLHDFDSLEKEVYKDLEILKTKKANQVKRLELKMLQALPLDIKIEKSKLRIEEWHNYWHGKVYVSFSGGKDSTVLLHLVRSLYPDVPAVFVNTGLEYPEIVQFVKTIENVVWLKPKMRFKDIIEKYGYPVISKEQSQYIDKCRNTKSEKHRNIRLYGNKWNRGKVSEKWKFLLNAPFKISDKCCDYLKKSPVYKYEKTTGNFPYIGSMAAESSMRTQKWIRFGCNSFDTKRPTSEPLSFWNEQNIWDYIKQFNIPYSKIYDMGYDRTGCAFCMFGCHLDKEKNKFQLMKETHPKLYKYCMENLGIKDVLSYCGIPYE